MEKNTRREFLTKIGITVGAATMGRDMLKAFPLGSMVEERKDGPPMRYSPPEIEKVDFRYAPPEWQSTFCFPDDPYKSLVGKEGQLLYGHPGMGAELGAFAHIVSVGLQGRPEAAYVSQALESPAVPIVTTDVGWDDVLLHFVVFATDHEGEGRVDNLMVEVRPRGWSAGSCTPEIRIKSASKFFARNDDERGIALLNEAAGPVFLVVNSPVELREVEGGHSFVLRGGTPTSDKPLRYFIRCPQAGQPLDKIEDGLGKGAELEEEARRYWKKWSPTEGSVQWSLATVNNDFLVASTRNIVQARIIRDGGKVFQVGPTVYRGLWVVDGTFLIEAARYMGYDKEAQQGLEAIWNRQDKSGAIFAGAGEAHWKDTAVAIYAIIRQAELTQNWDYFNELYPDVFKAMSYLQDIRNKAINDGTPNGRYGLLPEGFGDSGIGGIRPEFTNTLWALVALKWLFYAADRFSLPRRPDVRDFYGSLRAAFYAATRTEMRTLPDGTSYLPMLMKEDSKWSDADERKRPRPQAAQVYMSQAIYPGLLFEPGDQLVKGHLALMQSILREDIPAETGGLANDSVWPYNAPIAAQAFLWAGMGDAARKIFVGFLNHASPLYAWREEQSLQGLTPVRYVGDMPHNWASAECIRFLRHSLLLEDDHIIRLFEGLDLADTAAKQRLALSATPTRWGRISLVLEPVDDKDWRVTFSRDVTDDKSVPGLGYVRMPLELPGGLLFIEVKGVKVIKYGEEVRVPPEVKKWEATYRIFNVRRRKSY